MSIFIRIPVLDNDHESRCASNRRNIMATLDDDNNNHGRQGRHDDDSVNDTADERIGEFVDWWWYCHGDDAKSARQFTVFGNVSVFGEREREYNFFSIAPVVSTFCILYFLIDDFRHRLQALSKAIRKVPEQDKSATVLILQSDVKGIFSAGLELT